MRDALYLAWRYLVYHRFKTAILITSITLIVFLPVGLRVLVSQSADQLTTRAEATPLIIGARGSPLELVLNSLYFESDVPALMKYAEVTRVHTTELALAIPLYVRFRARGYPIVGTTLEYFEFREIRIAEGSKLTTLGDCVLGARVAVELGIGPGESVISSPENVFDFAGVYPLKMRVVGVLEFSDSPDDHAIFVDLKTAWVIEGAGHGHQDLDQREAAAAVLSRDSANIVANAALVQYNEITPDNIESFHFHGDLGDFNITAIVAIPPDQRSEALLRGRYESADDVSQIVPPVTVMDELLETILTVQSYVIVAVVVVGLSTLATAALVFILSLRLRRREIETMLRIGGSRASIGWIVVSEIVVVLSTSVVLAMGLTFITSRFGSAAIRALIL
jgi:putative ABC transport system permease protein